MGNFNATQVKVLNYLADPARTRASQIAADFHSEGVFGEITSAASLKLVASYLDKNPRGFCSEGIERARKAIGVVEKKKSYKVGDKVTIADIENGLPVSTGLKGDSKTYFVITGGTTVRQDNVEGAEKKFSRSKEYTIVFLP